MTEHPEVLNLIDSANEGSLATIDASGQPFVSAVGFIGNVFSPRPQEGEGISLFFLLSDLARHTKHLAQNPKASLLVVEQTAKLPVHEKKRATLSGTVSRVQDQNRFETLKQSYILAFPKSQIFFTLPDFRFYELTASEIYWIGGFGKAATIKW
ncbi:MAG: hypothetical protein EXS63_08020 [Candidatus Omnitrophica bacterium]|nr:hypothetical protein [Candidatus Omnitrophota bacterium]